MSAAVHTIHAGRAPVPQARLRGHPPPGVVCLAKVRRLRRERAFVREETERLQQQITVWICARNIAMQDAAQPDSVLAERERRRQLELADDLSQRIVDGALQVDRLRFL